MIKSPKDDTKKCKIRNIKKKSLVNLLVNHFTKFYSRALFFSFLTRLSCCFRERESARKENKMTDTVQF